MHGLVCCVKLLLNASEKPQVVKCNQVNLGTSHGEHIPAAGITALCLDECIWKRHGL